MKRVLMGMFGVALVIAASATVTGPARASSGASISMGGWCTVLDGNGNLYSGSGQVSVVTSSGHTTFICKASGAPNSAGRTVFFSGIGCQTDGGHTFDTQNIVSSSGNVTLRCRL